MNIIEITNKFPTDLSCIEYAEKIRFGVKPKCAYCNSVALSKRNADYRHKCLSCGKSTSVRVNTFFHDSKLPLKTWFYAFAIISDAKKGLSAMQLQRNLGIHYETAWNMYHKIRGLMAMDNKTMKELDGIVEMDETYVGANRPRLPNSGERGNYEPQSIPELDKRIKELNQKGYDFKSKGHNKAKIIDEVKRGRGTNKTPVVGIVERDGNVIAEVMKNTTYANLKEMLEKYVKEDDSVLVTDEFKGYSKMDKIIEHVSIEHKRLYSYKGVNTNSIESFWAIIKRQIMGQHHHVSVKHLPKYVSETVFKYNNRKDDDMFETLVKNSLSPISR